jgi:hypothetical protein
MKYRIIAVGILFIIVCSLIQAGGRLSAETSPCYEGATILVPTRNCRCPKHGLYQIKKTFDFIVKKSSEAYKKYCDYVVSKRRKVVLEDIKKGVHPVRPGDPPPTPDPITGEARPWVPSSDALMCTVYNSDGSLYCRGCFGSLSSISLSYCGLEDPDMSRGTPPRCRKEDCLPSLVYQSSSFDSSRFPVEFWPGIKKEVTRKVKEENNKKLKCENQFFNCKADPEQGQCEIKDDGVKPPGFVNRTEAQVGKDGECKLKVTNPEGIFETQGKCGIPVTTSTPSPEPTISPTPTPDYSSPPPSPVPSGSPVPSST